MKLSTTLMAALLAASAAHAAAPLYRAETDPGAGDPRPPVSAALREMLGDVAAAKTRIRLITENVDGWTARWDLLERAKQSLDITYYVFKGDIFGKSFLGLVLKKADLGVKVRLMVDGFGARPIVTTGLDYLKVLQAHPNVEVRVFNPKVDLPRRLLKGLKTVVAANHDKILLVDGRAGITGGRNIGWHYMADPADKDHTFEDTDILMEGGTFAAAMKTAFEDEFARREAIAVELGDPAEVAGAARELRLAYHSMRRYLLGGDLFIPAGYPYEALLTKVHGEIRAYPAMKGRLHDIGARLWKGQQAWPTRVFDKHAVFGTKDEIKGGLIRLVDQARESIYLQNAYVVMRADIRAALARASQRGVAIHLLTNGPASTNHMITQAHFLKDWKAMMAEMPTLRIYAGKAGRTIHSKCFVIDDAVASVGSYNLDPLSTDLNSEIIAVVDSPDFAKRLRRHLEGDIAAATEYKIARGPGGEVRVLVGPDEETTRKVRVLLGIARNIPGLRGLL